MRLTFTISSILAISLYSGLLLAQEPTGAPATPPSPAPAPEPETPAAQPAPPPPVVAQPAPAPAPAPATEPVLPTASRKTETQQAAAPSAAEPKQEPPKEEKSMNLTIAPLGVIIGGMKLTFSYAPASILSIDISPVYQAPLLIPAHVVGGELRFTFWIREPFGGFFIGPLVQASRTFPTDSPLQDAENYYGVTAVTPAIYTGYRWLWDSGFNLGLGGGLGWSFVVEKDDARRQEIIDRLQSECPAGATCTISEEMVGGGFYYELVLDLGYAF